MNKKLDFELNRAGVRKLMRSEEMIEVLNAYGSAVRGRCGDGFKQNAYKGKTRANVMIYADSYAAKRRNLRENTLLKALK